ncbi:DUF354 domain-containing protein [candidate division KSB1 bacterium]|nr:DUF354 domain-containing protein [candidate division KSB1 bacterium]
MNFWIDICHTPHVLLLAPLVREFEQRGHSVTITTRDVFQTCELLDLQQLRYQIVGKHYGSNKLLKIYGLSNRTFQLMRFARKKNFHLALCAGSPYQAMAANLLKIPFMIINDYEQSSIFKIVGHIATRLFFPAYIPDQALQARGIPVEKVIKFPGLKEEVYLADFQPDPQVVTSLGIDLARDLLVVLRPPAAEAHYHNPKSEILMQQILAFFQQAPNIKIVVIPRGKTQRQQFLDYQAQAGNFGPNLLIPEKAFDTLSLIYYCDLMLGGGGTMNREAIALGVPTYSFFCGPMGEVDRYLQAIGKLHFINSEADIPQIQLHKRPVNAVNLKNYQQTKKFIIDQIFITLAGGNKTTH